MASNPLDYSWRERRRRIHWYHWVPLAALALLLAVAGIYAWSHSNDPRFWDL